MKKVLNAIWDEFIYGGHFHSIGVAFLVYSVSIINNKPIDFYLFFIVYLGIQSAYLYNRYKDYKFDKETNPKRTLQISKYLKHIPSITISCCIVILSIFALKRQYSCLVFSVLLLLLGFIYSNFIKKYTSKIMGLKNYFIALSFCSLIILYSVYDNTWNSIVLIMIVFLFLRVLSNTIFFDIKDLKSDKEIGLRTFPAIMGKENALSLIKTINYLSVALILIGLFLKILPIITIFLIGILPFSLYYLRLANNNSSIDKVSYIYADGEYWFWIILLLMGKAILWN